MRSMRGERGSTRKRGVLDTVMIVSVGLALAVFGIWFFGFAGSSLPGSSRSVAGAGSAGRLRGRRNGMLVGRVSPAMAGRGLAVGTLPNSDAAGDPRAPYPAAR